MTTLSVRHPGGAYPVLIERGGLSNLGRLMRDAELSGKVGVVTSESVGRLYAKDAFDSLRRADFRPILCPIPDGESHKTLQTAMGIYDQLVEDEFDRGCPIVALGGGVVGDLAGFVAATFLRGLPFVQVPTTVLAMIDSSIGGKVAVDHARGKNLIGAFHQPRLVVADPDVLSSLPEAEFRSGMAEVIKHGIISAPDLFEKLETHGHQPIQWIIERAIRVKAEIIQEDPFERGYRAVLNLGHTYGHAFEAVSGFTLRHGEAVAIGLVAAARTACDMAVCSDDMESRMTALLTQYGLPVHFRGYPADAVREAMNTDKKRRNGRLCFVLPRAIGSVEIRDDVPEDVVLRVLESLTAR